MSGRAASTKVQVGDLALSVGFPPKEPPPGWQWVELNALAEMATGHTPSRNHPEYWGGGIKWMCASDARFEHGGVVHETAETINELGVANSAAVVLPPDTVCLARTGASIGYAVRLGEPMATNQGFVNWICGPKLSAKFYQYILVAEGSFLRRIAYGAAHHTIYFPEVKAFHVCVPPLAEQQRIVGVLDEAFAGLATAQAHAAQNLQNARALFESHLQSVFTHRGKGWVERTLGDLCTGVEYGSSAKSKKEGKIPVLRMGNIQGGRFDWENLVYTDDKEEIERYTLRHNDVLFNRTNSPELVGKTAIYKGERPAIFAGYLIRIHRKPELLDADYLNYFLNSRIAFDYGKTVVISSVNQANINGAKLKTYPIPTPPLNEQKRIVTQLDALAAETQRLTRLYEQKQAALAALKKSLLHQAFTGEL